MGTSGGKGVHVCYDGGDRDRFESIADICGVTIGRLEMAGLRKTVEPLVRTAPTETSPGMLKMLRNEAGACDLMVCPVSFRLSRLSGTDPVAIAMLALRGCTVSIDIPNYLDRIVAGEHRAVFLNDARIADGVVWRGGGAGGEGETAMIEIFTDQHALPDTVCATLVGRSLKTLVDHPDIPDATMVSVTSDRGLFGDLRRIGLTGTPAMITLLEAAETWERGIEERRE